MDISNTDFDILTNLISDIDRFREKFSKRILQNYNSKDEKKFNRTCRPSKRRYLSSTAICTYTLTQYSKFWDEKEKELSEKINELKEKEKKGDKKATEAIERLNEELSILSRAPFYPLEDYWKYILTILEMEVPTTDFQAPDEFTILNIIPLLNEIEKVKEPKEKEQTQIINKIVYELSKHFITNEFRFRERAHHPFLYYRFLKIVRNWSDQVKKGKKDNYTNALVEYYKKRVSQEDKNDKKEIELKEKIDTVLYPQFYNFISDYKNKPSEENKEIVRSYVENSIAKVNEMNAEQELDNKQKADNKQKLDSLRCFEWILKEIYNNGKYEMYRQIALHQSGDRTLFDVKRLVYSLLIVADLHYSNKMVVKQALKIIFDEEMLDTGLLPMSHVVDNDFVMVKGELHLREVSAVPLLLSFECFTDLLSQEHLQEDLKDYEEKFRSTYEWVKRNLWTQSNAELWTDNNPEPLKEKDIEPLGWFPEYESTHIPESWVACHVLMFLKQYSVFLTQLTRPDKNLRSLT